MYSNFFLNFVAQLWNINFASLFPQGRTLHPKHTDADNFGKARRASSKNLTAKGHRQAEYLLLAEDNDEKDSAPEHDSKHSSIYSSSTPKSRSSSSSRKRESRSSSSSRKSESRSSSSSKKSESGSTSSSKRKKERSLRRFHKSEKERLDQSRREKYAEEERKRKEQVARKAKREADEAERLAKEEAERLAKEEAEKKAMEDNSSGSGSGSSSGSDSDSNANGEGNESEESTEEEPFVPSLPVVVEEVKQEVKQEETGSKQEVKQEETGSKQEETGSEYPAGEELIYSCLALKKNTSSFKATTQHFLKMTNQNLYLHKGTVEDDKTVQVIPLSNIACAHIPQGEYLDLEVLFCKPMKVTKGGKVEDKIRFSFAFKFPTKNVTEEFAEHLRSHLKKNPPTEIVWFLKRRAHQVVKYSHPIYLFISSGLSLCYGPDNPSSPNNSSVNIPRDR